MRLCLLNSNENSNFSSGNGNSTSYNEHSAIHTHTGTMHAPNVQCVSLTTTNQIAWNNTELMAMVPLHYIPPETKIYIYGCIFFTHLINAQFRFSENFFIRSFVHSVDSGFVVSVGVLFIFLALLIRFDFNFCFSFSSIYLSVCFVSFRFCFVWFGFILLLNSLLCYYCCCLSVCLCHYCFYRTIELVYRNTSPHTKKNSAYRISVWQFSDYLSTDVGEFCVLLYILLRTMLFWKRNWKLAEVKERMRIWERKQKKKSEG